MQNPLKSIGFLFGAMMLCFSISAQNVPNAEISNGEISAQLYLPDASNGYYQGARFDWSGVIPKLTYKGHNYFGKWFGKYDPKIHDAIMGPVEAFDPLGYEGAKVGGHFTKIGIGVLEKYEAEDYHFSRPYKIVDHGNWTVDKSDDRITFNHRLEKGDYPYIYEKTIRLEKNKMIIDHKLTNMGVNIIDTQVFDHNFFVMDNDPIGPGYSVSLAFEIEADTTGLKEFAKVEGNKIIYTKPLGEQDRPRLRNILGYGSSFDDYHFRIENRNIGAGVKITCDRPLVNLIFWSMNKTLCPEPYIHVRANPNETFTWTIVYEYYTL